MPIFSAPAKINLSLRILRRREDGFHELTTRMCPIVLADEVSVEPADALELSCSDAEIPLGEENLAVKALRAFEKATGIEAKVRIHLEKHVPSGAGLGGGSSDAATVLMALDELYGTNLGKEKLAEMGGVFGSDVAFFVYGCSGRGEIVTPVEGEYGLSGAPVLLLKPPFGISTPWAYQHWMDSTEYPDFDYSAQKAGGGEMINDLERPVFEKYPLLGRMKMWLHEQEGVRAAMMSGSGSTMFAVGEDGVDLEKIVKGARAAFGDSLWSWTGRLG
jgi:4-diphosphocytidyl-2-C-methyl-D-erythritol kinase